MRPLGSSFERIIKQSMKEYLPKIYKDSKVVDEIIRVDSEEIEAVNADITDVINQFFVETATWGLDNWEKICGIPVAPLNKTYEQRRSVIKSKLRGVGVVNKALIKNVSESFLNGEVEVTEYNKNLLSKFSSGKWTLHENTRMRRANLVGKLVGSVAENPHIVKYQAGSALVAPSGTWYAEMSQTGYNDMASLNGVVASSVNSNNGNMIQQLNSFNLIEHTIRKHGVGVFGSAVTTAERVAWLKANVSKLTANWHGWGSGPAGNKATVKVWYEQFTNYFLDASHTLGTVGKLSTSTTSTGYIDSDGFVHIIAYADASNGTIGSTIRTDFIELEVYYAADSVPVEDYELTFEATGNQSSNVKIEVLPNQTYTLSVTGSGTGARMNIDQHSDFNGTLVTTLPNSMSAVGAISQTITTEANTRVLYIIFSCDTAGTFTFTNPQLEYGNVATEFEATRDYEIGITFIGKRGIPDDIAGITKAINDIIPAHLGVTFIITYLSFDELEANNLLWSTADTYSWDTLETSFL